MLCPDCKGSGKSVASHVSYADGTHGYNVEMTCLRCKGQRTVSDDMAAWMQSGNQCRLRRLETRQNLVELSGVSGLAMVDVSKMEHGKIDPTPLVEYWSKQ